MSIAVCFILGAALAQDAPADPPELADDAPAHVVQGLSGTTVAGGVTADSTTSTDPPAVDDTPAVEDTAAVEDTPAVEDMAVRVARLQAYKDQRMRVVTETELRGGVAAVALGAPQPAGSIAPSVVVVDPVFTYQTWGVYQGSKRLSPSSFLRQSGESFRADDLDRRTERDQRKARRWMMVAGAGAASLAMGMVGTARAEDLPQQMLAQQLTVGGIGVAMTGLVGASFPASRATRTEYYPASVLDRADAEAMAERHNTALQQSLGLTPEDLLLLELADSL